MRRSDIILSVITGFLVLGVTTGYAFAEPGEFEITQNYSTENQIDVFSLDLVEPQGNGVTFFGNGGYSADAYGDLSAKAGNVQVEIPSGSTIEQAYAYVPKYGGFSSCNPLTNTISIAGQQVTVDRIASGIANNYLCAYKADVTEIVKNDIGSKSGIVDVSVSYGSSSNADGVALVVVYSNPNSPEVSIAVMDGGQQTTGDSFLLGLAGPLDKTVPGFTATMSVGIGFGYQGSGDIHKCGTGQTSQIDVNGQRLTSCAGHYDDGAAGNGALITVGGVGDNTDNPPNPNGSGGQDDELYDISNFLNNGDTQIVVNTSNPSNNDIIFLSIFELTAKVSVGEICGDGIDNDEDGKIDEGCQVDEGPFCKEYDFNVAEQVENDSIETFTFGGFAGAEDWSGAGSIESVQGYTADGFDGTFLRNAATGNPAAATTLTLNNLPEHSSIDLEFLLAIIDSWDGVSQYGPDYFNVEVDGQPIFTEIMTQYDDNAPNGVILVDGEPRGWSHWSEDAYNMANEPAFQNIPHNDTSITIDFFASGPVWQGGNDESWALENFKVGLDDGCAIPVPKADKNNGGDNQWDTRPTFGVSHETRQGLVVENGFSFNGDYFTVTDNHHTDFAQQSVEIGTMNSFSATVYADKKLKVQEFLFGIPNVGESHLAELGIEVWYDRDGNIEDVKVVQDTAVIDEGTISVSSEMTKCLSTDEEPLCVTTDVAMTFLEPLMHDVMAIKAIDWANRDQRTYLNDGFDISGESLNPMINKMIPSNMKNQGLVKVTQLAKYSPYWQADDGRMFEMNSFDSFKEINQSFERFVDTGDARTRMHSGYGGIIDYEQNRASQVFDSTKLISELPDSFGYHFDMTERLNQDLLNDMLEQQEIAKEVLKEMDKQNRHY